ncbi:hypothetical protein LIER_13422 [Lithospermum erythrorhizon]|uniref:Uncharacterized protein n=1 Tax=Lithospermum erythrorhizon TaxID=34254 RepID=A0AAV3PVD4_LITER
MEGAGSRLGRASSRYGPITSSSIFTGPVRKWKRKWVLSETTSSNHRDGGGATAKPPSLLLPRWTPLSSEAVNEPKRKFRYTPVVELKQKKSEANKEADVKSKGGEETLSTVGDTPNTKGVFGKLNVDDVAMEGVQVTMVDMLPSTKDRVMDLFGKSHSENSNISRDDSD